MVSKKKLTAGLALVAVVAYTLTRWKGSAGPAVDDVESVETTVAEE